ncbi:zinc-finger homeodomain protein 10-like [Dorcoceras hygrometricum]|uniref:Zinc-finger homeodomain protein 10-like n=1 Tax=Dorcoceras hygrometricum TaxID=472368 RepID=A0A2Z7BFI5_9LAMI|nr:zinc-finger homeodomain protein 10-like [Dorcoceras hygrometricum]
MPRTSTNRSTMLNLLILTLRFFRNLPGCSTPTSRRHLRKQSYGAPPARPSPRPAEKLGKPGQHTGKQTIQPRKGHGVKPQGYSTELRTGSYELHQLYPTLLAQQTPLNEALTQGFERGTERSALARETQCYHSWFNLSILPSAIGKDKRIEHAGPLGSLGLNGAGEHDVDDITPTGAIEHAAPLGSLGLNGAGEHDVDDITPTGGEDV